MPILGEGMEINCKMAQNDGHFSFDAGLKLIFNNPI